MLLMCVFLSGERWRLVQWNIWRMLLVVSRIRSLNCSRNSRKRW